MNYEVDYSHSRLCKIYDNCHPMTPFAQHTYVMLDAIFNAIKEIFLT